MSQKQCDGQACDIVYDGLNFICQYCHDLINPDEFPAEREEKEEDE